MDAKATNVATTPIRLDILGPKGEIAQTSEFVKEKIVLGRILSADVRIDDPRVSRIHALIEVRGETVLVTDLASSHGTFLNGEKIVEGKIKFGDVIRLGYVEIKVSKGSGNVTNTASAFESRAVFDGEATQLEIDRSVMEKLDRRQSGPDDRRKHDAFPDEQRLDDRRQGDRRIEQRVGDRREEPKPEKGKGKGKATTPPPMGTSSAGGGAEMESAGERRRGDRRNPLGYEKRVGERRRGDRRVFDITSLERRIEDRRGRKSDDDILPEELEKAFEAPDHARELEVTALWGDHILDVSNFYRPVVLTVGESPTNEYIIPSEGIPDEFPLVTIEDDGTAYLAFTEAMSGTVRARDRIYTLSNLREEKFIKRSGEYYIVGLKQDDFAKIAIGTVNFFLLYVRPAPRIKAPPLMEKDIVMTRTIIGSVLLLALMFIAVSFVPKPIPMTVEMIPERFAKIVIKKKPNIPKAVLQAKGEKAQDGGSKMGEGGRPQGPEGEAGKPDKPKTAEKAQALAPKSAPKEKPEHKEAKAAPKPPTPQRKVVDQNKAKSVGLLKAFSQSGLQKDLKNLVDAGQGDPGKGGFDDFGKAVNGLRGHSIEEGGGAGGKGLKGVDAGGGGKTIGIDGPSTHGLGRGMHGDGIGEGLGGPGRLGMKGEHAISIASENVQVLSGLPKDVINAVVQRHRAEIRACYDAALQRNPNLRGKVVIAFSIQPNGIVSSSSVKESTLGDGGIENCITSRVRTWIFPKPEAPVVTEVSAFPFYLNPSN